MRVYDQGSLVRVCVSRREIDRFKRTWPCSGLPSKSISFVFDKVNGDLVDLSPSFVDGSAATALSQDAKDYLAKWLDITNERTKAST